MRLLLLSRIGDLEKQEGDARNELQELERKSSVLMEKKLENDRLKRKVDLYSDMTTLLERKNQEALIKKAEKPEEVTVAKPAVEKKVVPEEKAVQSNPLVQGEYPYSIYLSSLKTLDQAKRAIAVYANKGIQAYWVKVNLKEKGE